MAELESYWEVVEPMFDLVDIDDSDSFFASITDVPRDQLLLYAAHFCLSEIWNGGFLQFFYNSTGLIAPEAALGFEAIGMVKLASVVSMAAVPLGYPFPRNRKDRWDAMLVASGRDQLELEEMFKDAKDAKKLYSAFLNATKTLPFSKLDHEAYDLAETEAGGFQDAATRFARSLILPSDKPPLIGPVPPVK